MTATDGVKQRQWLDRREEGHAWCRRRLPGSTHNDRAGCRGAGDGRGARPVSVVLARTDRKRRDRAGRGSVVEFEKRRAHSEHVAAGGIGCDIGEPRNGLRWQERRRGLRDWEGDVLRAEGEVRSERAERAGPGMLFMAFEIAKAVCGATHRPEGAAVCGNEHSAGNRHHPRLNLRVA